jgi:hypothetical protein
MYRNVITNEVSERLPLQIGATYNPSWEQCRDIGWRIVVPPTPCAEGYERLIENWREDGDYVVLVDNATLIQDRLDAEAAARAAERAEYLAGYDVSDRPLRVPSLEIEDGAHVYGIVVDGDAGEVVPIQRESERLSNADFAAAREALRLERRAHRERITAIKTDLDQVETALDAIDVTQTGALGVAVAATTGTAKTALQEVRKVLVDVKAAAKNLRQAAEKIRKEIK